MQDILLIAFGLAWNEFLGVSGAPIAFDIEGHGRQEEIGEAVHRRIDLSRTTGWFTTKYPASLAVGELSWAQVSAGEAALGPVIKTAKEQLRALPDGLTYGLLRYLNPGVDLTGPEPTIGFNYLGRLGAGAGDLSEDFWRISADSLRLTDVARRFRCHWRIRWNSMPAPWTPRRAPSFVPTGRGRHRHWTVPRPIA